MRYRVRATLKGRRITSKKWWASRQKAATFAKATRRYFPRSKPAIVKTR